MSRIVLYVLVHLSDPSSLAGRKLAVIKNEINGTLYLWKPKAQKFWNVFLRRMVVMGTAIIAVANTYCGFILFQAMN